MKKAFPEVTKAKPNRAAMPKETVQAGPQAPPEPGTPAPQPPQEPPPAVPQAGPEPQVPGPVPGAPPPIKPENPFQAHLLQGENLAGDPAVMAKDLLAQQGPQWTLSPQGLETIGRNITEVKHIKKDLALVFATLHPDLADQVRPEEIWQHLKPEDLEALKASPRGQAMLHRIETAATLRMGEAQTELQGKVAEQQNQVQEAAQEVSGRTGSRSGAQVAPPVVDIVRPATEPLFTPEQLDTIDSGEF